jgi:3(or 17)beta-hydroxysteroid dehydrogenase
MSEAPSCIRGVLVPSVRSEPYLNRRIEVQPRCLVTPERRGEDANCARMEPLFAGTSQWVKTSFAPCGRGRFGAPTTRKGRGVQPSHRLSLSGTSVARLEDKIVLIAGAAGAIGQAVAAAVKREGGVPVATDLARQGGIDHPLDVTVESDWHSVLAEVERAHGRLDGLVNAAGIAFLGSIEDTDYASWRRVLAVNLDGTFLGCKHALALLKPRGGSIVNLSSISGIVGGHNLTAYNASKGGVRLLTKSVALHGARLKPPVRCNSVHPAFLEGPMVDDILAQTGRPEIARGQLTRDIPLGRLGAPSEVADLCVYLLSDESKFVTGSEFVIDGGLTAR